MTSTINRRHVLDLGFAALAASALPSAGSASDGRYPTQPIRLIVPRTAGGVVDVIARQWGGLAGEMLGGTVVIENVAGGGGTIGSMQAARAAGDGHTLVMGSTSDLVLNPIIRPSLGYDPVKDFTPISIMAVTVCTIAVTPSLPITSLRELAAYAKANPGKLSYASAGAGSMANLAGELFKELAGTPDIVHVPYKSTTPGIQDLIAGHIPLMTGTIGDVVIELHRAGKIRLLVAASEHRVTAAPEIPTSAEAGYPDFIAQLFMGLFTTSKAPRSIVDQLTEVTAKVMTDKEFHAKMIAQGFDPIPDSNPESAARYLAQEVARWTPVLKRAGMITN